MSVDFIKTMRPFFEGMADGVVLADEEGTLVYSNRAARRLLGPVPFRKGRGGVCGLICRRLVVRGGLKAEECPLRRGRRRAESVTFRGLWPRRSGARPGRELRLRGLRLRRAGPPPVHLLHIEDVTREVQGELRQEEWRGMVVHDLRSPLSNVLGALRMVQEVPPGRGLDEQESELVQFGVRSCLKMRTLIDEYLQVVRLESGTMPVRMACVDVVCLVREGVAEFKEAAHAAGIEFRLEAPKTQFCNADPELLIRALQNLLDNAMKHTPRGGGVTVSVRALGREVLIGVSDTGRGIAKRDLPHIFDRYYQGSSPGRKGLGLGLTFCREALRSLGGRMTVESEEGRGAAFTMVLPGSREEPGG